MKTTNEFPSTGLNQDQFYFTSKNKACNGTKLIEPGDIVFVDKKVELKGCSFVYLKTENNQEFVDCYPIKVEGNIKECYPITKYLHSLEDDIDLSYDETKK